MIYANERIVMDYTLNIPISPTLSIDIGLPAYTHRAIVNLCRALFLGKKISDNKKSYCYGAVSQKTFSYFCMMKFLFEQVGDPVYSMQFEGSNSQFETCLDDITEAIENFIPYCEGENTHIREYLEKYYDDLLRSIFFKEANDSPIPNHRGHIWHKGIEYEFQFER